MNNKCKALLIVLSVCVCIFLFLFFSWKTISFSFSLSANWGLTHVPAAFSRMEYEKNTQGFQGEGETFMVIKDGGRTDLDNAVKEESYQKNGKDMQVTRGTAVTQTEANEINRIIGTLDPWRVRITEGFEPARDMVNYVIEDKYLPDMEAIDAWLHISCSDGSSVYILQDIDVGRLYVIEQLL